MQRTSYEWSDAEPMALPDDGFKRDSVQIYRGPTSAKMLRPGPAAELFADFDFGDE